MVDSKENYKFDLGVKGLKTHEKVVEAKAFNLRYCNFPSTSTWERPIHPMSFICF